MKKYVYLCIDVVLSIVIGVTLSYLIHEQLIQKQQVTQERQVKVSEQYTNKAIALLEGDGNIIKSSQVKFPKEGEAYAVIHNDDREFSKDLYFGDTTAILDIAIGQYTNSGIPGQGKPLLVAGHNGTHFKQLRYFEKGDFVQIDTSYGNYVYEVYDMETMLADDFDTAVLNKDEETLIMYCCYPFDSLSTDTRYFVYAKKVKGPVIEGDGSWKE